METDIKFTFDLLPVAGVILSLLAWYIPKFKDWYAKLKSEDKQLFMIAVLVVTDLGALGLSALGFMNIYPVDQGWKPMVWYPLVDIVGAIVVNAGVYKATSDIFRRKA